ncbi:uncharacterized protein LOC124303246 [Neodiprion virginianus]|uniref:uncharacterized protein LOC124303246 n=1 Tax=Neodiprion virginianus TaxID=2961670 RepID=UPI001EE714EE|nr:uncharacterized protein LOC124303246 [Neodiprion virginianus]
MGYDNVISHLGEFGPYQRKIFVVIFLPMISCAFHLMGGTFLAGRPDFRCLTPEENPYNATYTSNTTQPVWDNETEAWTSCERYDLSHQVLNNTPTPPLVKCDSFVYDESQYGFTVSTNWNLVCDDAWLKVTSESLFMLGVLLGALVMGGLSDKYGRKTILIWGSVLQLVTSLLVAAAQNMIMYIVCRTVLATSTNGLFVVSYVTAIETIGQRTRKPAALGSLFFIVGSLLTVCLAYFIRNWRMLQVAFTIPTLVFLGSIWYIPESARWLITKGRLDEAKKILREASVENKVELTRDALDNLLKTDNEISETRIIEKTSIYDLLRYPIIRKRSLILFFVWFVNNATYYGLSWNAANLAGDVYVNSGIAAAVELPALLFMISTIDKCPRKVVLCGCMLLAATSLLSTILVPNDIPWATVSLAMIGKLSSAASYSTLYIFSMEQYPTTVRNIGVGASSAVARIAGVVTPLINNLSQISVTLPLLIYGCGSLMAGLLLLLLPETAKKKLPETIEELEEFKEKGKTIRMGFDQVISQLGTFGPYQRRIYLAMCLPIISSTFHVMGGIFLAGKPDFRCLTPGEDPENATYLIQPDLANVTYPWDRDTGTWSRCKRYDLDYGDHYETRSDDLNSSMPSVVTCDSFVYDKDQYGVTVTTKWDLVCDNAWLKTASESLFMLGVMVGVLTFSTLSDRYGRRTTLIWGSIVQLISGLLIAVAPNFTVYVIGRTVVATTTTGVYLTTYIAAIETVGPKKKLLTGISGIFFIIGALLSICFAYFIKNWRILQIAFATPTILLLVFSWSVRESARWLLSKGRVEEAIDILRKAFIENGVELAPDALNGFLENHSEDKSGTKKYSVFALLKNPSMRKRTLILFVIWIVNNCTYYGLSWITPNLGGNVYLNSGISAGMDLPAYVFLVCIVDKCPRRFILCSCMWLVAITLLSTFFVPTDMGWLVITLSMIGKLIISISYTTISVFTAEQFPTVLRNTGVGTCSAMARLGGVVAPMINELSEISVAIPLVTFGSCSLLAGLITLLLPETLETELPETIQEMEDFGKKKSKTDRELDVILSNASKLKASNNRHWKNDETKNYYY